jgi:hypothetical protein
MMADYHPVDADEVRRNGMRGVIATGGGIGLVLFNSLLHIPVVGWVIGGALVVLGIMGVVGRNRTDKVSGAVLIGAGVLGLTSFVFKGLTGFVLGAGSLGLIAYGILNLIKFARGLKSRS